jgi:hypothetical protein
LMEVIRVVTARDATTPYDRLLVRLFDVSKAEVDLDPAFVEKLDPKQVKLFKTVQILTNHVIYADSYLRA